MRYHLVDTFADDRLAGNPAAVVEVDDFPPLDVMQTAAHRIGLAATAFVVPAGPGAYRVRWFTHHAEINLCGHGTIAGARYLFTRPENAGRERIEFRSDHGVLTAERQGDLIAVDLPAMPVRPTSPPPGLLEALRIDAGRCAVSHDDVLVELPTPSAVAAVRPDFAALAGHPFRGHIVTAAGEDGVDFVSRTFFPALGVDEDQVCVSAHGKLAPYWGSRLGRSRMVALQLSERGGRLEVEPRGDRVRVLGTAVPRGGDHVLHPVHLRPPTAPRSPRPVAAAET